MINLSFNVIQSSLMFTLVVGMIVAAAKKPRPKEQEAKTQKPQSQSGKKKLPNEKGMGNKESDRFLDRYTNSMRLVVVSMKHWPPVCQTHVQRSEAMFF